jgi:hypothetical protein
LCLEITGELYPRRQVVINLKGEHETIRYF